MSSQKQQLSRKVYIHGPGQAPYMLMFLGVPGYVGVKNPEDADIIVFTGGEDVSPHLYNEKKHHTTYANTFRDAVDQAMYEDSWSRGQFLVGICRGGQFLNVMNGGHLWQDVDNHALFGGHDAYSPKGGRIILVSSTHHQMMRIAPGGELLLYATESERKDTMAIGPDGKPTWTPPAPDDEFDVEAVWYPETRSFCFQPHPEFNGFPECRQWFFETLNELYQSSIIPNRKKRA